MRVLALPGGPLGDAPRADAPPADGLPATWTPRRGAGADAARAEAATAALPAGGQARRGAGVLGGRLRAVGVLQLALLGMLAGNLGRAPVLFRGPEWPVLLNDVLVAAAVGAAALACARARRLRLDAVALVALAFAALGAASALVAAQKYSLTAGELLASYAYLARWLLYLGVYVALLNVARDDDAGVLWAALERMVLVFAAFGVVQVFTMPGFAQLVYPAGPGYHTWDVQGRRLVSTLLDPNFAGMLTALALLVQVAQLSYGVRVRAWKPLLLLAATLMTVSRGAVLALAAGVLVVLAVRGLRRGFARVLALALAATLPFVPALVTFAASFGKFKLEGSAMARVQSWGRALTVIVDNPVLGVGFNTYTYVQRAYGWSVDDTGPAALDGGLLFVTVLSGLVGLAVYSAMLALVVARCRALWRAADAPPESRAFALGTAAATVALVVHSVTVNSLLLSFLMEAHWVLAGLVFLHARRHRRARAARAAAA